VEEWNMGYGECGGNGENGGKGGSGENGCEAKIGGE
jgi:hypothetical protein